MNRALILAALFFLSRGDAPFRLPPILTPVRGPGYFDTFQMELLLDRLHCMTGALERVNQLNRLANTPMTRANSLDHIQESLEAVRDLLCEHKAARKLDSIASVLSGIKQLGNMQDIMSGIGPILSMFANRNDK
jgi:hypothetical protein